MQRRAIARDALRLRVRRRTPAGSRAAAPTAPLLRARPLARAGSLALACALAGCGPRARPPDAGTPTPAALTYDHGGIVRGDRAHKRIALVFTGGDYGDGTAHILDTLGRLHVRAGMFVTGDFLRQPEYAPLLQRAVAEGHYVGPHSDRHLLYAPWDDRARSLVTRAAFEADLRRNIADLKALGALSGAVYFIPPYEWYNDEQVRWAADMGVTLFNFSPGSGSNRDYLPESDARFVSSQQILDDILAYERRDPAGLNGYILLLHLGADRKDKMYALLAPLIGELRSRGYTFVRIDELLGARPGARDQQIRSR